MTRFITVTLTPAEQLIAQTVGLMRQASVSRNGWANKHGRADGGEEADHILGAAGEMAAAKVLGRYWGGDVNTFKRADIGHSVQVKTRSRHDWDLIVRPDDDDGAFFILVTGSPTDLRVHGWMRGGEAKRDIWLKPYGGRPPAYFVPQAVLRPLRQREVVA